jgi:hypothetical protein
MTEENVNQTDTGDTSDGDTTNENSEQDSQKTQEDANQKGDEQTDDENSEESSETEKEGDEDDDSEQEFVPYNFDEVVKLPKDYTLLPEAKEAINALGKEHNIKPEQVQGLVDKFMSITEANNKAADEAALKSYDAEQGVRKETLQKEWGDKYAENKSITDKALERFFPKSLDHMFGEVEKGKTRDFGTRDFMPVSFELELFEMGKKISEDSFENGQGASGGKEQPIENRMFKNQVPTPT